MAGWLDWQMRSILGQMDAQEDKQTSEFMLKCMDEQVERSILEEMSRFPL